MKNATISDVAKASGVSKSTISNYLNGNFGRMSDETKNKIKKAIDALGYTPSLSARRLSSKNHSRTICLAIPGDISHVNDTMYYPVIFATLGEESKRCDYNTLIYSMGSDNVEKDTDYLKSLASSLVDGLMIYDLEEGNQFFREFEKAGIPYVCVGKIDGIDDYNYVASDHAKAMREAIRYLISLEHKKIAVITEGKAMGVVEAVRHRSFMECVAEYEGLEYSYHRIDQNEGISDMKLLFNDLLSPCNRPTAVVIISCFLDPFMDVIKGYGIKIPEELSVIILDYYKSTTRNHEYREFTRVDAKAEKVSKIAMGKLLSLIDKKEPFQSELIDLKLCVKSSTSRRTKQGGKKGDKKV